MFKLIVDRQRERLQAREGERCLLHTAAKYGQVRLMLMLLMMMVMLRMMMLRMMMLMMMMLRMMMVRMMMMEEGR